LPCNPDIPFIRAKKSSVWVPFPRGRAEDQNRPRSDSLRPTLSRRERWWPRRCGQPREQPPYVIILAQ